MIKVLLFHHDRGFEIHKIENQLDEYYRLLECDTITSAFAYDDCIFADDEALLKEVVPPMTYAMIDIESGRTIYAIHGPIMFVGRSSSDGETVGLQFDDIIKIKEKSEIRYIKNLYNGKMTKCLVQFVDGSDYISTY